MATIQFKNGDDYLAKLSKLESKLRYGVIGGAVYAGAGIVTDAVRRQIEQIPTDEGFGTESDPTKGPSKKQIAGLEESLGIAESQEDGGFYNVKVGFDGYNNIKTRRWPKGQPNQMVARSIERGTSYMQANPFMKRAVASTKKQAVEAMKNHVDREIEKIMEG